MHVRDLNDVRVLFLTKLVGLHGCRRKEKGALFAMNVGRGAVLVGCGIDGLHECLKGGKLLRRARVNRATEGDRRLGRKVDFHDYLRVPLVGTMVLGKVKINVTLQTNDIHFCTK